MVFASRLFPTKWSQLLLVWTEVAEPTGRCGNLPAPQTVMEAVAAAIGTRVTIDGPSEGFDTGRGGTSSRLAFPNETEVYVHLISRF